MAVAPAVPGRYPRAVFSVRRRSRHPLGRRPRRARVFVVTATGRVALIERRRQGLHYWAVPGGGIEPGESPEEAADERSTKSSDLMSCWIAKSTDKAPRCSTSPASRPSVRYGSVVQRSNATAPTTPTSRSGCRESSQPVCGCDLVARPWSWRSSEAASSCARRRHSRFTSSRTRLVQDARYVVMAQLTRREVAVERRPCDVGAVYCAVCRPSAPRST